MYKEAMEATGLDYQTLANAKWAAEKVEFSRRRENLSFTMHAEVAALPPAEADAILDRAKAEGLSTRHDELFGRFWLRNGGCAILRTLLSVLVRVGSFFLHLRGNLDAPPRHAELLGRLRSANLLQYCRRFHVLHYGTLNTHPRDAELFGCFILRNKCIPGCIYQSPLSRSRDQFRSDCGSLAHAQMSPCSLPRIADP